MYKNHSEREKVSDYIVNNLTTKSPTHTFDIDLNIAKEFGLRVEKMKDNLYKKGKHLIKMCEINKNMGVICKHISDGKKPPYFELFECDSGKK